MFAVMRQLPAAGVLAALALTTPACASQGTIYRNPVGAPRIDRRAYMVGYDQGRQLGEQDARRNRPFDPVRHKEYRSVDGRSRGYGNQSAFTTAFRQGFMSGYEDGYRVYARNGRYRPYVR